MKIGDTVRIKPGLVGQGMTGVIQKIAPWNIHSPYQALRENYYWLVLEDGTKYHFHGNSIEPLKDQS